jgi:hypothetical protein
MIMRHILILLIFPLCCCAQNDTLCKRSTELIPCTISNVGSRRIHFIDKQQNGRSVELETLSWYSRSGVRTRLYHPRLSPLPTDSVDVSAELAYLRNCMSKFHSQYTTGVGITLIGGALAGSSFFISGDENLEKIMGIGGVVMMVVGTAVSIDAHRWFGKAGWGVSGKGNMVEVRYRFR